MKKVFTITLLAFLAVICWKQQADPQEAPAPKPAAPHAQATSQTAAPQIKESGKPSLMDDLWITMNRKLYEGNTEDAISLLEGALEDKKYQKHRTAILLELMSVELNAGKVGAAKQRYLAAIDRDIDLATNAFGMLVHYFRKENDFVALTEWCEALLAKPFPEAVRKSLYANLMEAHRAQGKTDDLKKTMARCLEDFPGEQGVLVVDNFLKSVLEAEEYERFDKLLSLVVVTFPEDPAFRALVTRYRFWEQLSQGRLMEAGQVLDTELLNMEEQQAARALDAFVRKAKQSGQQNLAELLCTKVIEAAKPETQLFQSASFHWIMLARDTQNAALTHDRLLAVRAKKPPTFHLIRVLGTVFYFLMERVERDKQVALVNMSDELRAQALSDISKAQASTLILDGSFLLKDYDRALRVLQEGIPLMEEDWHATLIPKVKAHKALADGNKEEAIRLFRQFMERVAASDETGTSPATGERLPKEAILGFNAVRIAGIWRSLGNTARAKAAVKEAEAYYKKALELVEQDSPQYQQIRKSLDELQKPLAPYPKAKHKKG